MPRVDLKKKEYKIKDIKGWVVKEMKLNGLRQEDVAAELGIKQSAMSQRIAMPKKGKPPSDSFSYGDMLTLFKLFNTPDEERLFLLRL